MPKRRTIAAPYFSKKDGKLWLSASMFTYLSNLTGGLGPDI
jgi:hypothetical protein